MIVRISPPQIICEGNRIHDEAFKVFGEFNERKVVVINTLPKLNLGTFSMLVKWRFVNKIYGSTREFFPPHIVSELEPFYNRIDRLYDFYDNINYNLSVKKEQRI